MRFIKKCRWIKTFLAAILIISMTGQTLTVYAWPSNGAITAGSQDSDKVETVSGNTYSAYGWIISIQEVDNTATNVASGYTESQISFDNAWLHSFPDEYINDVYQNSGKYAFIRYGSSVSSKYYVASPAGGNNYSNAPVANQYASGKGSGNFSTEAQLLEKDDAIYENILMGIKTYSLTSTDVINAAGDTSAAVSAFVKLWQDSGSVDDTINDFVFSSDDYYEQAVKYLDVLIIVNAMCGNAWSSKGTDYIQTYLDNLNADGSEKFVAIVVAAAVNYTTAQGGYQALMTLPVYYARRTGLQTSTFSSWDGSGDWDNVQSTFNSYPTNSRTGYHMEGTSSANNTQKIWWNQGESGSAHMATTVYPVGSDGSLGFCGYTYIAPSPIIDDPDDIINPPSSSSSPSSSVAAADVVTPTFTVEVTTENEYMQRDTSKPVTATVTIDMGQTDAVQKTFKNIYTSLKNKEAETGETYKTAIEVFVERTFSDSSGKDTSNAVMDSDHSNGYFASAVQPDPYTNCVVYRWQGTDWDSGSNQLQYVMDGTHQIVFDDEGLSLASVTEGTPLNATYHVGIRMAIYPSSVSDRDAFDKAEYLWIFQGEGKTICSDSGNSDCSTTFFNNSTTSISTSQSAHDDAEWICPKGVQWYSSLREKICSNCSN